MREYQAFMAAVRAEIDRMVRSGYRREEAVETLLRRIKSLSSGADGVPAIPTEREVRAIISASVSIVMHRFIMAYLIL